MNGKYMYESECYSVTNVRGCNRIIIEQQCSCCVVPITTIGKCLNCPCGCLYVGCVRVENRDVMREAS